MNDFLEQLAREELNPTEVREILRRLACTEFGGPEQATILDVAEASGASPETVGRMLADIRGTSWVEWRHSIEGAIAEQARRLQLLESKSKTNSASRYEDDVELYERVERGRRTKQSAYTPFLVIPIVMIAFVLASKSTGAHPFVSSTEWYPGTIQGTYNDHKFGYNGGCEWSEADPTTGRPGPVIHKDDSMTAMSLLAMDHQAHCP